MKHFSLASLLALSLLAMTGCSMGDRLFSYHQPWGGDSGCGCNDGHCCNGSGMTDGGSYGSSGCPCNQGACGNCGTCGNGGCGNGACGNGACGNGACGNGDGGCGPNGCGANGDPNLYGRGVVPRGVGGQYLGAAGPPTGAVAYPYYTNRGPRDFLAGNPPSIGP